MPAWGHPISQGVFPLFLSAGDSYIPIGTAFSTGAKVSFVITAMHNIRETLKHEHRLSHLLKEDLSGSHSLKTVGLAVMHHYRPAEDKISMTLWPLESVDGAPPTDVVYGFPKFSEGTRTLANKLSFGLPSIGQRVLSIGYSEFEFPAGGIPKKDLLSGEFDWSKYSHRLFVVEGWIKDIFTQRFSRGFVAGPCFTFDSEIRHGMSGGPIIDEEGTIIGVNSAGASLITNTPASIGSLLFPTIMTKLSFGLSMGPVRINAKHPVISLIESGTILTDGRESELSYSPSEDGTSWGIHPQSRKADAGNIHDDFDSKSKGIPATKVTEITYIIRKSEE